MSENYNFIAGDVVEEKNYEELYKKQVELTKLLQQEIEEVINWLEKTPEEIENKTFDVEKWKYIVQKAKFAQTSTSVQEFEDKLEDGFVDWIENKRRAKT